MRTYTIELTKKIVVTVEAESEEAAGKTLAELEADGDMQDVWRDLEPTPVLIHVGAEQ